MEAEEAVAAPTVPTGHVYICGVCGKVEARYRCPRCALKYCSATCYGRHGEGCTEQFYQEQVTQVLKSKECDEREREKMMEMLERVQEQHREDEEKMNESSQRERYVRLYERLEESGDPDELWSLLSPSERKEFEEEWLQRGAVARTLPWYTNPEVTGLLEVQEMAGDEVDCFGNTINEHVDDVKECDIYVNDESLLDRMATVAVAMESNEEQREEIESKKGATEKVTDVIYDTVPPVKVVTRLLDRSGATQEIHIENLLPLKSLTKVSPSPLLPHNLTDILFAYCFASRLYLGDYGQGGDMRMQEEFVVSLLGLSHVLSPPAPHRASKFTAHKSADEAARALVDLACAVEGNGKEFAILALEDVAEVLRHRWRAQAVLVHTHQLIASLCLLVTSRAKLERHREKGDVKSGLRLATSAKKVFFYLCWFREAFMRTQEGHSQLSYHRERHMQATERIRSKFASSRLREQLTGKGRQQSESIGGILDVSGPERLLFVAPQSDAPVTRRENHTAVSSLKPPGEMDRKPLIEEIS